MSVEVVVVVASSHGSSSLVFKVSISSIIEVTASEATYASEAASASIVSSRREVVIERVLSKASASGNSLSIALSVTSKVSWLLIEDSSVVEKALVSVVVSVVSNSAVVITSGLLNFEMLRRSSYSTDSTRRQMVASR